MSVRGQEETGDGKEAVKQKGKCTGNTAVEEEVLEGSDFEMGDEDKLLKVPRLKRKSQSNRRHTQAKKGTGSEEKEAEEQGGSESESCMEEDSADSDEGAAVSKKKRNRKSYSVGKIKVFLQKTKNMKVEDYFSVKELLANSDQQQMRSKERGGFTEQEVYRLKKIVQTIRKEINDEDEDV